MRSWLNENTVAPGTDYSKFDRCQITRNKQLLGNVNGDIRDLATTIEQRTPIDLDNGSVTITVNELPKFTFTFL